MSTEPFEFDPKKQRLGEAAGWHRSHVDGESSWILDFYYPRDPIPMNGSRGGFRSHARKVRGVKMRAFRRAQLAELPPMNFCQVQLTWYVLTRGRRDVENLSQTLKAMCDALVQYGLVADDVPALMKKHQNRIVRVDRAAHAEGWMELTIRPWAGLAADTMLDDLNATRWQRGIADDWIGLPADPPINETFPEIPRNLWG